MLFRFYYAMLVVRIWLRVSPILAEANGQGAVVSLSQRAHDMLRKGLESINDGNTQHDSVHDHRRIRASGCPFALVQPEHRSDKASRESGSQLKLARLYEEITLRLLASDQNRGRSERMIRTLEDISEEVASVSQMCPPEPQDCNVTSPYRTADGSCNNLDNPSWGKAGTCMPRLLEPDYANGVNESRVATSGRPLPNARMLSYTVHPEVIVTDPLSTHMTMLFGQFLDHDITHAQTIREAKFVNNLGDPFVNASDPINYDCCSVNLKDTPSCYPVDVPEQDPFYKELNVTCLSVEGTVPCFNCRLGPRQHSNSRTSYIDASHVYGVSDEETSALCAFTGGLLLSQTNGGLGLPPGSWTPDSDQCSIPSEDKLCLQTGDGRSNQHPALTALQIVWFREHNRIATELQNINSHWSDEKTFQETRRIVVAEMQHIVYREWLPDILGAMVTAQHDLYPLPYAYTKYDASVDATIHNEFSAAGFRFGHSLTNDSFLRVYSNKREDFLELKDNFFNPFGLYNEDDLDALVRGMAKEPSQYLDRYGVHALTQFNLKERDLPYGADLFMVDIQRGRERGIQGYAAYLDYCTGTRLNSFDDLEKAGIMPRRVVRLFSELYEDVHDIDLFSGALSGHPLHTGLLGPTFSCLVANVFKALKFGDRFYYEHGNQTGTFTPDQLRELKTTSLSRIICDNTNIERIQRRVFRIPRLRTNPEVACDRIPGIHLRHWDDTRRN